MLKVAIVALAATSAQANNVAKTGDGSACATTCMDWEKCYETRCARVSSPCTHFFNLAGGTAHKLDADCDKAAGEKCVPNLKTKDAAKPHICITEADMATCTPPCASGNICKRGACVAETAEIAKLSDANKQELYKTELDTSTFDKIRTLKRSGTPTGTTSSETVNDSTDVSLINREVLRVDSTAGKVNKLEIPDALTSGGAVVVDENTDFEVATELKVLGDNAAMTVGRGSKTKVQKFTVAAGKSFEMQFGDKAKTTELLGLDLADKDSKLSLSGGKVDVHVLDKSAAGTSKGTLQLSAETELSGETGKYLIEVAEHASGAAKAEIGFLVTAGDIVGDGELAIKGAGKKLKMTGATTRVGPKLTVEANGEFQSTSDDFQADKVAIKGMFKVKDNSVNDVGKNTVAEIEECPAGGEVILEVTDVTRFDTSKSKTVLRYDAAKNGASKRAGFKCKIKVSSTTTEIVADVVTAFNADLNIGAKYQNRRLLQTNDCVQAVWGETSLEVAAAPCLPSQDAATTTTVSVLAAAAVFAAMF